MKRVMNYQDYKNILPYDSEIFGIYQPLLGWKSKRTQDRIDKNFHKEQIELLNTLLAHYKGVYKINLNDMSIFEAIESIDLGTIKHQQNKFNTQLLKELDKIIPDENSIRNSEWKKIINNDTLNQLLNTVIKKNLTHWMRPGIEQSNLTPKQIIQLQVKLQALYKKIDKESIAAGFLLYLVKNKKFDFLRNIFYKRTEDVSALFQKLNCRDPFEYIDPKNDLDRVGLSPIGVAHLFRQYFYEFDTFLGSPVSHIWLSPGSTAELIEVTTRKSILEKTTEQLFESNVKIETALMVQDEISNAVKEENKSDVTLATNVNAKQKWGWGSASQSASFDMNVTQQKAREINHKHMRQQTENLSTEIRKSYKSTFRTSTEYTDTSSKRYVLTNNTHSLINYELRRKMRQVGIQVQDIGTYLCWQTYVDEPGDDLGIANLVHINKSPNLDKIQHPEKIIPNEPFTEKVTVSIPFIGKNTSDKDISYTEGEETEHSGLFDLTERIEHLFPQKVTCSEVDYYLDDVRLKTQGAEVQASITDFQVNRATNEGTFTISLDYVHFHGQNTITVEANLNWKSNQDIEAINRENEAKLADFTEKVKSAYKNEFVKAAKERIKLASKIHPRNYNDLREEERIVVYRKLIQELLAPESIIPQPDAESRHVVSELINSIFDVDKMLYFIAPEWWQPKKHFEQSFGVMTPSGEIGVDGNPIMKPDLTNKITEDNLVGWGGINAARNDNYYITEDSTPANLGSSLGWLLQLDGDDVRNAFLNAPWVKAVIPIRPGKECAALNWLKQIEGTNGIDEEDIYTGTESELRGKPMLEVLEILAKKVKEKHLASNKTSSFPDPDDLTSSDKAVTATPIDRVYEHGFYPLKDGFKIDVNDDFEIFDQWIEILPTDQIAAVEVKYDPITGRQTQ